MKIIRIVETEFIRKTDQEIKIEKKEKGVFFNPFNEVPLDKPKYIIEVSVDEFQLISFYLELEKRNPIMNVEVKTELKEIEK